MFPSLSEAWRESPPHLYRPHSEHGLQARVWGLWACCLWSGSEYSQQSPGWSLSPWPTSRQWESHPRTAGTGTWSYCTDPEINVTASWQRQRSTQHAQIHVLATCERPDIGVSLSMRNQPLIPSLKTVTMCHWPTTMRLSLTIWAAPVPQLNLEEEEIKSQRFLISLNSSEPNMASEWNILFKDNRTTANVCLI